VAAQATLAAFATEQASHQSDIDRLTAEQATAAARATQDALNAQATIEALATLQAQTAAQAAQSNQEMTAMAASGFSAVATQQAAATAYAALVADATRGAMSNQNAATQATAAAATNAALVAAQQEAQVTTTALAVVAASNALNPDAITKSITVDPAGVQAGDDQAISDAQAAVRSTLAPFASCRAGFVLITAGGADLSVGAGVRLAEAAQNWVKQAYPDVFGNAGFDSVATTTDTSRGKIEFKMFFYSGCASPSG
ncbi:MAG TPA: hypothetical protein VFQ80_14675, partial [Thermomicrobiales bacterium]|nr:hypothetical protein [Thermomicrobiales bacterium]